MKANKNFGMYTDAGNEVVADIVEIAKKYGFSWRTTHSYLCDLAENENFSEATDTEVRYAVYDACGFKTEFYI